MSSAGLLVFAVLAFLLFAGSASREEVARVPAPGGRLHAVLVEVNRGATTSLAYSVRLESPGLLGFEQEVAALSAARRSPCAFGASLRWAGPHRLLIEYLHAEQARTVPAEVGGRGVRIELRPGVADPHAPCGGMAYNLGPER